MNLREFLALFLLSFPPPEILRLSFFPRITTRFFLTLTHRYYALCCQNFSYPRKILVVCLSYFFQICRCLPMNPAKSEIVIFAKVIAKSPILHVTGFVDPPFHDCPRRLKSVFATSRYRKYVSKARCYAPICNNYPNL